MEGDEHHQVVVTSAIFGTIFSGLGVLSFSVLWAVNWRPWRIYRHELTFTFLMQLNHDSTFILSS